MKKNISRLLLLCLILFFGILSSCSQDNNILATSKLKDITRGDFYTWLEGTKLKKESVLESKDKQKKLITDMALELFVLDKARVGGFDKSEHYILFKERAKEITLQKYFLNEIADKATFNEPAIRVSYIFLGLELFKQDPANKNKKIRLENREVGEKINKLMVKAKGLIQRLDNGDSFQTLAAEFSEDATRKSGGDFGYIISEMMPAYFSEPAFGLKEGEYTKEPVKTPKGIYLIKIEDKVALTKKNVEKIIEDQAQRERVTAILLKKVKSDYLAKIMSADDVEFLFKEELSYKNTDTIFRIGDRQYTISDLDKAVVNRSTQEEREEVFINGDIPERITSDFIKQFYLHLVWSREAVRLGVDKKPEYLKELEKKENVLLASEYLKSISSREIFISDQELKEEYEKTKDRKYSVPVKENGVLVNRAEAFDEVKDLVYKDLGDKLKYQRAHEWKKQTIKDYDLKILE